MDKFLKVLILMNWRRKNNWNRVLKRKQRREAKIASISSRKSLVLSRKKIRSNKIYLT